MQNYIYNPILYDLYSASKGSGYFGNVPDPPKRRDNLRVSWSDASGVDGPQHDRHLPKH